MFSFALQKLTVLALVPLIIAQSTTYCTLQECKQDNCYRNIEKSTTFCASFTAPPPSRTAAPFNSIQASCGSSRLSSACSCLYPPGATSSVPQPSITRCTTIPLAPSPTVFNYDFSNPAPVYVEYKYNVDSAGVVSDSAKAHSPPNVLRTTFNQNVTDGTSYNIYYYTTGLMRPAVDYLFTFWVRQDPLAASGDPGFQGLVIYVYGSKDGPINPSTNPPPGAALLSVRSFTPNPDTTWRQYSGPFKSKDYQYYCIIFGGVIPGQFGVTHPYAPPVYFDDLKLVQTS